MVINATHRFKSKKKADKLDPKLFVFLTYGNSDQLLMTVAAYRVFQCLMSDEELETQIVSQVDPLAVDWMPGNLNHIHTEEDVRNLKKEIEKLSLARSSHPSEL